MSDEAKPFEGWCILELMGHRRLAGYVSQQEIAGAQFLRIDIPGPEPGTPDIASQFYAPAAVYCITPTGERESRAVAVANQPTPVTPWEMRRLTASANPEQATFGQADQDDEPF